jgi:ribosomal protein S18 acetylase RimI-like enzyme
LGSPYYWVLEENARVLAVLACPEDPPGVAWVRLFAHTASVDLFQAWEMLWHTARLEIPRHGAVTVAVIAMHDWFGAILADSGFAHTQDILMLELHTVQAEPLARPGDVRIREMTRDDLAEVARVDAAAFKRLWQNPESSLSLALPQASVATVAENERGLVGYQISTANPFGAHLARLAVRPEAQNQGLGAQLVADLVERLRQQDAKRLTVNTQSDNHASLALYRKMGFTESGERFPVYCYDVPG